MNHEGSREPTLPITLMLVFFLLITAMPLTVQVSLPIVRQFVKNVEEKALGVKVLKGVRPDQQLVKVVNDQLIELMGGQQEDLNDPKEGPQVLISALHGNLNFFSISCTSSHISRFMPGHISSPLDLTHAEAAKDMAQ